jgi:hypothetical protein
VTLAGNRARITSFGRVGHFVNTLLTWRAFDLLLGLEPIEARQRIRDKYVGSLKEQAPSRNASSSSGSSFDLSELIGSYDDAGYGVATVCPLLEEASHYKVPYACDLLYARIKGAQDVSTYKPSPNPRSFLIDFPRMYGSSHIVAVHDQGNTWFGTMANVVTSLDSGPPKVLYYQVNALTIWLKKSSKGKVRMSWHGIFGKDLQVPEAEDFVEVSFAKL